MYKQAISSSQKEKFNSITVDNPIKKSGSIYYNVRAYDSTGDFVIQRTYSEF